MIERKITNLTEPLPRYRNRDIPALRRMQHAVFFMKGRKLTPEEKGAIRYLSSR